MVAREKFQLRDRVQLNQHGHEHFEHGPSRRSDTGIVVGFSSRSENCVRILLDSYSTIHTFHMDFFDVVRNPI
jgi:hypothetical protein